MSNSDDHKQVQQHQAFINEITQQVSLEKEHEVPSWNRAAAFEQNSNRVGHQYEKAPWWHWQSFGGLAFAASISVVALLSIFINRNESVDQQAIAMLVKEQVAQQLDIEVNRKLREFANEQQVILANYKAELSERQEKNNLQLAGYVMTSTRSERKEDLADFVSFINAQRKDEQLTQKIRFQQLEQAIGFRKASYNPDFSEIEDISNE